MTRSDIIADLERIATVEDFTGRLYAITDHWTDAGAGVEAIEPILRFMEDHPSMDYGAPGALVHFVERFHDSGYAEELLKSILRRPTPHTVWMLNRVINGTPFDQRRRFVEAMAQARQSRLANGDTLRQIDHFLEFQHSIDR